MKLILLVNNTYFGSKTKMVVSQNRITRPIGRPTGTDTKVTPLPSVFSRPKWKTRDKW